MTHSEKQLAGQVAFNTIRTVVTIYFHLALTIWLWLPGEVQAQMGPRRSPIMQTQEMGGWTMEHPVVTPPFYHERTFHVLSGLAAATVVFLVYRMVRRRRRKKHAPVDFVNEAILVVDLVDSTYLATHYGDGMAMRAKNVLKDRILQRADARGLSFVENIGDGYFMTFPSVEAAVGTATALVRDLRNHPEDLASELPLDVRVAISYGEILVDPRGGRHGTAINKAFRLEALSAESFTKVEGEEGPKKIADRNRIFLDEEAVRELNSSGVPLHSVGFCALKGFSGLHRVFEVLP